MTQKEFIDEVSCEMTPVYAENCNRLWRYLFKNKQDAIYVKDSLFFVELTLRASKKLIKEKFQDIVDILTIYDKHNPNDKSLPFVMSMLFTSIVAKIDKEWFDLLNPYMPLIYDNKSFANIVLGCKNYLNRDNFYQIVYDYNCRTDLKEHEDINWLDFDIAKTYFTQQQYDSLLQIYKEKFNTTPIKQNCMPIDCQIGLQGII